MGTVLNLGFDDNVIPLPARKKPSILERLKGYQYKQAASCTPIINHLENYLEGLSFLSIDDRLTKEEINLLKEMFLSLLPTVGGFLDTRFIEKVRSEMTQAAKQTPETVSVKRVIRDWEKKLWDDEAANGRTLIPGFNYPEAHARFVTRYKEDPNSRLLFLHKASDAELNSTSYVPANMELVEIYFFVVLRMIRFQFEYYYNTWSKTQQVSRRNDFLLK